MRIVCTARAYNLKTMATPPALDLLAERVEWLLVRYEELQRTNALLAQQVESLTQERDSLRSRLAAARARVDALLDRLPPAHTPALSPMPTPTDPRP
jgi:cell division protein ZapB